MKTNLFVPELVALSRATFTEDVQLNPFCEKGSEDALALRDVIRRLVSRSDLTVVANWLSLDGHFFARDTQILADIIADAIIDGANSIYSCDRPNVPEAISSLEDLSEFTDNINVPTAGQYIDPLGGVLVYVFNIVVTAALYGFYSDETTRTIDYWYSAYFEEMWGNYAFARIVQLFWRLKPYLALDVASALQYVIGPEEIEGTGFIPHELMVSMTDTADRLGRALDRLVDLKSARFGVLNDIIQSADFHEYYNYDRRLLFVIYVSVKRAEGCVMYDDPAGWADQFDTWSRKLDDRY